MSLNLPDGSRLTDVKVRKVEKESSEAIMVCPEILVRKIPYGSKALEPNDNLYSFGLRFCLSKAIVGLQISDGQGLKILLPKFAKSSTDYPRI